MGAFLPISDMLVQKLPSKFFETKNNFLFGAGPNFGSGVGAFSPKKWSKRGPKRVKKGVFLAFFGLLGHCRLFFFNFFNRPLSTFFNFFNF